ncbi:hypothetical protein [Citrobacter werkmanii]|uniref:hypothetical protein n=1 Tax=Citrobacter werkmanii TaxID=67827 RepID=UPI0034D547AF
MTSREKFEAWYLENFGFMEDNHETLFERSPDGDGEKYYRLGVRIAHESWQASESASQQKLTDMAVQLANAESKCRELAAENGSMNKFIAESCFVQAGEVPSWHQAIYHAPETPATDAFLAEVRAQGVEMFVAHCQKRHGEMLKTEPNEPVSNEAITATRRAGEFALYFAAQLRKGVQS